MYDTGIRIINTKFLRQFIKAEKMNYTKMFNLTDAS